MCTPPLIIRADATPQIGTGHVMRCLALAQAAEKVGITVHLVGRVRVPWVQDRLQQENINFIPLSDNVPEHENPTELIEQIRQIKPISQSWVVLDGYHFGLECQKAVREAGYKLLLIDDYAHLPEYSCDILLNQNIGSDRLVYHGDIRQKLLGSKYVLLRREFVEARNVAEQREWSGEVENILISLGGGDFISFLQNIAKQIELPELASCTVRIIAGSMCEDVIQDCFSKCPAKIEVIKRVMDMPSLLLDTDLCISAGGSTCWELCCLGIPFLTVGIAENQTKIIQIFEEQGIAKRMSKKALSPLLDIKKLAQQSKLLLDLKVTGIDISSFPW